jgi:soluble lytic murein transglycosylase-like protein
MFYHSKYILNIIGIIMKRKKRDKSINIKFGIYYLKNKKLNNLFYIYYILIKKTYSIFFIFLTYLIFN